MADARPHYQTAEDIFESWREGVYTGKMPTLYPVGTGTLTRIELGPGRAVLVGGLPGGGKTALVMQLVIDALRAVPMLRIFASSALAWGLSTLLVIEPQVHAGEEISEEEWRHLVLVYDVSPSMFLKDAGRSGDQTRHERSRELIESMF